MTPRYNSHKSKSPEFIYDTTKKATHTTSTPEIIDSSVKNYYCDNLYNNTTTPRATYIIHGHKLVQLVTAYSAWVIVSK